MCGFVQPAEPLVDTLNTTCRRRYAEYNDLGEDDEDAEAEESVSDSSEAAAEPVDMTASGPYLLCSMHSVLLLDKDLIDTVSCCT